MQLLMKSLIAALALGVAASFTIDTADAQRGARARKAAKATPPTRARIVRGYGSRRAVVARSGVRRSSTVDASGLCQRDTGKPDAELDFRNACDTQEFWARIESRGIGRN